LPVTFYNSFQDVPDYSSYAMKGRTYRYYDGKVQYPFGYGLSYTSFTDTWLKEPQSSISEKDNISFSVNVKNTGTYDGDEVLQVYIEYPAAERMPLRELKSFKRLALQKGKSGSVSFSLPAAELKKWDLQEHQWKLYPGDYYVCIGKNSRDMILKKKITVQ